MANTQQNRNNTMKADAGRSVTRARPSRRRATRKAIATVKSPQVVEEDPAHVPQATESDLLAAVASLYEDNLRPYGRLVRKRLGEIAMSRGQSLVDGDLGRLRRTCEECSFLIVQPGEGSEWSVLLMDREPTFVDVYSIVDTYPASLWTGIRHYLRQLDEQGGSLPGGRYSCARALLDAGLPFLRKCSLGEVCHIVQLAMSEKKLLGYLDGTIAPYERSNSMMKDTAAEQCRGSSTSQQIPLASWASARSCMVDVLESALRKGKKQVPISTLKRLFRSRFHIELSETALGYTKLSDLLQDKVFSDICSVKLLERGYVVLPSEVFSHKPLSVLKELSLVHQKEDVVQNIPNHFLPLSKCRDIVRNTFIQMNPTPPGSSKRSRSVPKNIGSQFVDVEEGIYFLEEGSTDVGSGSLSPTLTASPLWTPRQQMENDMDCLWQVEEIYPDPLTISQCCGWDMTMDIDSSVCLAGPFTCDDSMCHFSFPTEAWLSGNQTCATTWTAAVEPAGPQFPQPEPEYLSKKACDGSVVRNTFIEVDTAPCSPNMWRCRSQSVPRNLGSDKGPCGDTFVSKPVELNVESKPPTALISPSPFWSPRSRCADNSSSVQETAKCVLCLSEFL